MKVFFNLYSLTREVNGGIEIRPFFSTIVKFVRSTGNSICIYSSSKSTTELKRYSESISKHLELKRKIKSYGREYFDWNEQHQPVLKPKLIANNRILFIEPDEKMCLSLF